MTHHLPGGGVFWVYRARSPVPPRLPDFATPRSVCYLAAVAAGAYPLRRPPDVWSPGAPAPPGSCYWLVASGTRVGWRGGCLVLGLVRGAVRLFSFRGCSPLVVCARRWRPVRGAWASAGFCVFPVSRFPPRVSCAVFGGPSRPGVPGSRSLIRHSMRSVRSTGSVRLPFWSSPRALCVYVRPHSRGFRAPCSIPRFVWRGYLARSRCWALVGPFHAVRAPPRVLPPSPAPFGLLGGGSLPGPFPPSWLGAACSPWGGCGRGDPSRTPPRALLRAGFARYAGDKRVPQGGRLLPGCGGSGVGRSPSPDHSSFRACGRGPLPTGCGCRGCGRGDLSSTLQRALLRAGFARRGGGRRVPKEGRLLPGYGASGVGRSPTPGHSSFWACGRGRLPTGCGCGGCGRGNLSPTPLRALLRAGSARREGGTRVPRGGRRLPGRPGGGALPPPTIHPFGRAAGAHYPLAVGAGSKKKSLPCLSWRA